MSRAEPTAAWDLRRLRLAIDAAGVALWSWNVDTGAFTMDERGFCLWGLEPAAAVVFEDLSAKIHPADRDRVRAAFSATRAIAGAYEIDFRIIVDETVRWVSARGKGEDADIQDRVMFGVFIDVTGRKQAEEANELLAGEMSHRVKNLLSIAGALTAITFRNRGAPEEMARELTSRLTALGRAHDLVRPLPGRPRDGALLGDLVTILLAPYDDMGAFKGRIRTATPRMSVGETAATTLALVLHELATNSMKYGALSAEEGTLDVAGRVEDEDLILVWTERGGPPVTAPEGPGGYGSDLLSRSLRSLDGAAEHNWASEGAIITVRIPVGRLAA